MNISILFKSALAFILYQLHITQLLYKYNKDSIILCYHRVLPEKHPDIKFIEPGMYVTTKTFEQQMKFCKDHFNLIDLLQIDDIENGKKNCIVTFDDGWQDNYKYAYPILKKYKIPATIFLATNLINSNSIPWFEKIARILYKSNKSDIFELFNLIGLHPQIKNSNKYLNNRQKLTDFILNYLKKKEKDQLENILHQINLHFNRFLHHEYEYHRLWLSWDEINEMSVEGIQFGAHTHNHLILTNISLKNAEEEIQKSKQIIQNKLEVPINTFCYPNGNYNLEIIQLLKQNGFELGVTTEKGTINKGTDSYRLNRLLIHNDMTKTIPMFACKILNLFPFY